MNVYNFWYVKQTYVLNCAQSAARTRTCNIDYTQVNVNNVVCHMHNTLSCQHEACKILAPSWVCYRRIAAKRLLNFCLYQIVLIWNEPMFLWQNKLSCNGSFKLVCQVHGSGSIILIRHLHISLLCQEQSLLYVLDMSTCTSRLIECHRVTGAAWDLAYDKSEPMCAKLETIWLRTN